MKILIIGGSDAGISAALRARELSQSAEITVLLADDFPNFSICGLPFFLSGETPDWKQLAHRTEFEGIQVLRRHTATIIDAPNRFVLAEREGRSKAFAYDRLIVGSGATPIEPPIQGLRTEGVFLLHTMEDSFQVQKHLTERKPQSAVVIGAGYIGVEMADALSHRGLTVTLVSRPKTVLPTVEPIFGQLVGQELETHGVKLWTGVEIAAITQQDEALVVESSAGEKRKTEMVIVATGVKPSSGLARTAGIELGERGAIRVNRSMETSVPDIYAAGDCAETWHRLLESYAYLPLGTTSHKQGRVAGENAIGGSAVFAGALGTQVVKVFDLAIARTGLLHEEANKAGYDPFTIQTEMWDHKAYYPGAKKLWLRLTGDRSSGRLLGAQLLGSWKAEVSKRIDIFATALFHGMTVDALNDLDLSYTPPLSSPWDPVQMGAQTWSRSIQTQPLQKELANAQTISPHSLYREFSPQPDGGRSAARYGW